MQSQANGVVALEAGFERAKVLGTPAEIPGPAHQCAAPNLVALRTKDGVASLSDLVRSALRLRPDRIPIGEVRGAEALDLLKAWGTGHPGGIGTIHAGSALPIENINLVGPDTLTGEQIARIWIEVLGRPVVYGGDDPSAFEANMANFIPKWQAYEMRLMAERYVSDGMTPGAGDRERLTNMLGRPLHAYRDFAATLGVYRRAVMVPRGAPNDRPV